MSSSPSTPGCRSISATHAALGSAAPTRTPTGCSANTSLGAPTCACSTRPPSTPSSTAALDKPWASRHHHRHSQRRCADPLRPPAFLRQPPLPRRQGRCQCPEPVSEINAAQPALSQGPATVVRVGQLLGDARRLHRRPATAPAGSTTSSEPAGPGSWPRPPAAPVPTVRCTARALGWQPAPPAWPRRPPAPRPRRSSSPCADLPDDGLRRCRRPGSLLEARWSVSTVCPRRHFGAARLRRPAAGRTPAWSRSPSSPQELRVRRHRAVRSDG